MGQFFLQRNLFSFRIVVSAVNVVVVYAGVQYGGVRTVMTATPIFIPDEDRQVETGNFRGFTETVTRDQANYSTVLSG